MKQLAIITGGSSSEREIALRSAANVAEELRGIFEVTTFDFPTERDAFLTRYQAFDLVIPVLHGKGGEDGTIQGFLETLGLPYLFSGVQAQAIALDKAKTKEIVSARGIKTPQSKTVMPSDVVVYDHPVVVKPFDGGSSLATMIAKSAEELIKACQAAFEHSSKVLIEDFVAGQEFTVAVVEKDGQAMALPVIAIKPKDGFFDFASKYNQETLADEICPAPISKELSDKLQTIARQAHQALGCRHVSRTDFIVDFNGEAWFLEINTIPGMTATSLLPKALAADGLSLKEMLSYWINNA